MLKRFIKRSDDRADAKVDVAREMPVFGAFQVDVPAANAEPTVIAEVLVQTMAELEALPQRFKRVLPMKLEAVRDVMCPVQLGDGTVAIMVASSHRRSDMLEEVKKHLRDRRHNLADLLIVVPQTLLQTVQNASVRVTNAKSDPNSQSDRSFNEIVTWAVRHDASDIHINAFTSGPVKAHVRFSINNLYLQPADEYKSMSGEMLIAVMSVAWQKALKGTTSSSTYEAQSQCQCQIRLRIDDKNVLLRVSNLSTDRGPCVTMRLQVENLEMAALTYEQLGYLPSHRQAIERQMWAAGGGVVLGGDPGAGKSTTMAVIERNLRHTRKLIELADPVEFIVENAQQVSITEHNIETVLKAVKRSAMHDLAIGEIRDKLTGLTFVDVTSAGGNVLATTHAGRAYLIPDRLAQATIGVPRDFMATPGMLKLLIYQALLPRLCPHCSQPFRHLMDVGGEDQRGVRLDGQAWAQYGQRIDLLYKIPADHLKVRNPEGCEHCRKSEVPALYGYDGRAVVAEMLEPGMDDEFLRLVARGDNIGLRALVSSYRRGEYFEEDMTGKSVMECAIYKSMLGQIDPRDIETRFHTFESELMRRDLIDRRNRQRASHIGEGTSAGEPTAAVAPVVASEE